MTLLDWRLRQEVGELERAIQAWREERTTRFARDARIAALTSQIARDCASYEAGAAADKDHIATLTARLRRLRPAVAEWARLDGSIASRQLLADLDAALIEQTEGR